MTTEFLELVELSRLLAQRNITEEKRKLSEQYFTPPHISKIMTDMFTVSASNEKISVLDPCCGIGNLGAAVLSRGILTGEDIELTLIEKDLVLAEEARRNYVGFKGITVLGIDFFDYIQSHSNKFDRIILNPPYSKIAPDSSVGKATRSILGQKETNLYSAFIACCLTVLKDNGELVAIIPRSFCNGTTFRNFRFRLLSQFHIDQIYLFESRKIFSDSGVLQETLIMKISRKKSVSVKISHESCLGEVRSQDVSISKICFAADKHKFIHIPTAIEDDKLLSKMMRFPQTLSSLGCLASTGKVVDFRLSKSLRHRRLDGTVQLLYQESVTANSHVDISAKTPGKLRYLKVDEATSKLLIQRGNYVLVRRISFKEAGRRIICSPLLACNFETALIGVENHLNYIWGKGIVITQNVCLGLSAYLSTNTVDQYIRRFSGHTQINAADLNSLPIPSLVELENFGAEIRSIDIRGAHRLAENKFFA